MDPLSIATSVVAISQIVTTVSTTLATFIRDTNQVDDTVDALLREVNSLKRAINAIEDVIQQPTTLEFIEQDHEYNLENSVDESLVDCRATLERLDNILEVNKVKSPGRNPFGQALKQIKVNWTSSEFTTIRRQTHSHCLSMQLALQTINVHIATKGPGIVVRNLGPKIDKLNDMLAKMDLNAQQQDRSEEGAQSELATTAAATSLRESANKVVSNASDIMGSRSSNWSGTDPTPPFGTPSASSRPQSHSGSRRERYMSQDSLSADHRDYISGWSQRVRRSTRSEPETPPSAPSPRRTTRRRPLPRDRTASFPSETPTVPEDIEADGDIKLELIESMIEIARGHLSSAQKQYQDYSAQKVKCKNLEPAFRKASNTLGNVFYKQLASHETIGDHEYTVKVYKEHLASAAMYRKLSQKLGTRAEKCFNLALTETSKLTPAKSKNIDLHEIRLNLAFSYEVCEKSAKAELLFRALADNQSREEIDAALMLQACQALGALYLQQKRLDEADAFCKRALWGRRRIFGKEHAAYRESMLLNIKICRAKGQSEVADAYMAALLPGGKKFRRKR